MMATCFWFGVSIHLMLENGAFPAAGLIQEETEVRAEARCVFNALDAFDYDQDGLLRRQFVMIAVLCAWVSGIPIARDDASEAAWFPIADLSSLEDVSEDVDTLAYQALRLMRPGSMSGTKDRPYA